MKETQKQLNDLIRNFYDESAARQAAREIEQADRLLAAADSPRPREEVLKRIKQKMVQRSTQLRRKRTPLRLALTAVAACLLIGVGLIFYRVITPPVKAVSPEVVQAFFSDQSVENITSNLDEISDQIYVVSASNWDSNWEEELEAVEEIEEMDLLTDDNDFWKG